MEQRTLNGTGESVTVLGFGTWPLAGQMGAVDRSQATSLVREAVDRGITLLDTAEAYGDTESILGEALGEGYREKVFLATKVSHDFSRKGVRNAAVASLKAMRTDRIDLYQLHRFDNSVPVEETLEEVTKLKEEGLVRFIGVSNFTKEQLIRAQSVAPIVSNQINYNALNRNPEGEHIDYCSEAKVSIIGHSSLAKGLLTGKYAPGHRFARDDERSTFPGYSGEPLERYLRAVEELSAVASDWGVTPVHAALAWVLARQEVATVLMGPKNREQLLESLRALEAVPGEKRPGLRAEMDRVLDKHALPPLCPFSDQLV